MSTSTALPRRKRPEVHADDVEAPPPPKVPRDWFGHSINIVIAMAMSVPVIFSASHFLESSLAELKQSFDKALYEQARKNVEQIAELHTVIATMQATQASMLRNADEETKRRQVYEAGQTQKLDTALLQLGSLVTDQALLRKDLKR